MLYCLFICHALDLFIWPEIIYGEDEDLRNDQNTFNKSCILVMYYENLSSRQSIMSFIVNT